MTQMFCCFNSSRCADEVDDAGDAEMFGGAGAGFHGDGAKWCGAALGEDDAVDAGAVGDAEECAEVLWIFDAVEREKQAGLRWIGRGEEVFDRKQFLRTDEGDDALVGGGSGEMRELVAGFLADADTGQFAIGDEAREAFVVALGGDQDVIEAAPAGLESFGNGVHAVENFHVSSVDGASLLARLATGYGEAAFDGFGGAAFAAFNGLRIEDAEEMVSALGWRHPVPAAAGFGLALEGGAQNGRRFHFAFHREHEAFGHGFGAFLARLTGLGVGDQVGEAFAHGRAHGIEELP